MKQKSLPTWVFWVNRKNQPWKSPGVISASHPDLKEYRLYCDGGPELIFTENESNTRRLWGQPGASAYVKDAFHAFIISEQSEAVNPDRAGTKAAAHYVLDVPAGGGRFTAALPNFRKIRTGAT